MHAVRRLVAAGSATWHRAVPARLPQLRVGTSGWIYKHWKELFYLPEHLTADAANIRRWRGEGRDVFVYYNNDWGGHAVTNARDLLAAAG